MPRPTVVQQIGQAVVAVGLTPTPLSANPALQNAFIDSFLICVYTTAANSVFFGDSTVSITTGIEIPAGVTVQFSISNERQLYEVQNPLLKIAESMTCENQRGEEITFVYFDLSQLYLVAVAATNAIVMPFKRAYV